jgi:hypothetical protein
MRELAAQERAIGSRIEGACYTSFLSCVGFLWSFLRCIRCRAVAAYIADVHALTAPGLIVQVHPLDSLFEIELAEPRYSIPYE